jgi:hypothetical protein
MAARLRAEWLAVYVATPATLRLPEANHDRVVHTLRLAEQLRAETVTLSSQYVSETLLNYAHARRRHGGALHAAADGDNALRCFRGRNDWRPPLCVQPTLSQA